MRFQMLFIAFAAFISLASLPFAANLIFPVSMQIEHGSQITIGNVGPGQTFFVIVYPKESSGGKFGLGGAYDQLAASSLPDGWTSKQSQLYANPLQADITVPKDAQDGEYEVKFTLWDEAGEGGLGGNVSFIGKVTVTRDVMDMQVEPPALSVGAGQPARYAITIVNKGIANDVFTVDSNGVRSWEFRRSVYIPSGTSKTINYEVVGNEESDYQVKISVRSSSSDSIYAERDVSLRVNTNLFSDYRAVNMGVLLFPITEAPLYFLVGLLSNLIP